MKTLVLHTPKGGSGKSTLAREIATMAARSGVSAALADLDPQETTAGWYQRRQNAEPALVDLGAPPFTAKIASLAGVGLGLLVIDTPPAQPAFLPALLAAADLVLVPVRPTRMICWRPHRSRVVSRGILGGCSSCPKCHPGPGC
jgi:chromosome partitioning protein